MLAAACDKILRHRGDVRRFGVHDDDNDVDDDDGIGNGECKSRGAARRLGFSCDRRKTTDENAMDTWIDFRSRRSNRAKSL